MTTEPLVNHRFEAIRGQLGQFGARLLEEALLAALPSTWERRAAVLSDARPRPEDFNGKATREELSERWQRLTDQATACSEHAEFLRRFPDSLAVHVAEEVAEVMAEGVAA